MTAPPRTPVALTIPEIGPSIGRLTDPPATAAARGPLRLTLDDLRLGFVTDLFEMAGSARAAAAHGDTAGAVAALSRPRWLAAWDRSISAAGARITALANAGFRAAAVESRLPAKRLARLLLLPDDSQAIVARLGAGGGDLVAALEVTEEWASGAAGGDERAWREWIASLGAASRRVESAWLALEAAASREEREWAAELGRVRAWRRPAWPIWLATALAFALATGLGLLLGGYLPVPAPLRGFTDFWWARM